MLDEIGQASVPPCAGTVYNVMALGGQKRERMVCIQNRYTVIKPLSEGGMRSVLLVEDQLCNHRLLALKKARLDLLGERGLAQFRYEFTTLYRLRHPNLPKVYDFGTIPEAQELFFTMEYVAGEDWKSLAQRQLQQDGIRWLYDVTVQVCRGLHYIHSHGLIHYDVKPTNVRVTPDGVAKVVDFGLIGPERPAGHLRMQGTPGYIAPEIAAGEAVDHRADLYALGVSLYEIVTGQLPPDVLAQLPEEERAPSPSWPQAAQPDGLMAVIHKLMAPLPEDRYASAEEVIAALGEVAGRTFDVETVETKRDRVLSGDFVGRETEMNALKSALGQVRRGKGKLIYATGAMGIGKSRLVRELSLYAQTQAIPVCVGACSSPDGPAYQPWIAIFRQIVSYCPPHCVERVRRYGGALVALMPTLGDLFRSTPLLPTGEQETTLQRLAIEALLTIDRPILLVIEDIHRADPKTLALLDLIAKRIHDAPLLLLVTLRDAGIDDNHPIHALLSHASPLSHDSEDVSAPVEAPPPVERYILHPLDERNVTAWIGSMLSVEPPALPPALLPWLMKEGGGNPAFIVGLMLQLVENGQLRYARQRWHVDEETSWPELPEMHRVAVRESVARINAEVLDLLGWAAVIGYHPDWSLVVKVTGLPRHEIEQRITQAVRHDVLVPLTSANGDYRFCCDYARRLIYERLSSDERRRRHMVVADVLQARYPESEVVEPLARHAEQAGMYARALRYFKIAGDRARHAYANRQAAHHYDRALALIHEGKVDAPASVVYAILAGREEANRRLGRREAQRADLEEMAHIAAVMGDVTRQIEVMVLQAELEIILGNHTTALELARRALSLARQVQNRKLEADGLDVLGEAHSSLGQFTQAYACHTSALALYRELHNRSQEAHTLWHLGVLARYMGKTDEGLEHLEAALNLFRTLDDRQGEADALNELGNQVTDYAQKRTYYEQSLALAEMMGDHRRMARTYNNLALIYWALGLHQQAREYVEEAVSLIRASQTRLHLALLLETLGRVYFALGNHDAAETVFHEGLAIAQEMGDRSTESLYWYQLGRIALARGQAEEARALIHKAGEIQQELGMPGYLYTSLAWEGAACLALGDREAAEQCTIAAVAALEWAGGGGEFPPQEVWWWRHQVLRTASGTLSEAAVEALQQAYTVMMQSIARLTDEGLRRNYLNRVQINRDIITAWTRLLAAQRKEQVLEEVVVAVEAQELDEATELARLRDRLRRMLDISVRMNETHDATSLLHYVMDQVIELSGAERGVLVLVNEEGQMDFRVAVELDPSDLIQHKARINYTVLETVSNSWQPVLLQDTLTDQQIGKRNDALELNLRSVLCVPLLSRSKLIGMIYADNRSVSGRFSRADLDLMMIFANQAATAIENARLYEDLVRANEELANWAHTLEERVAERTAKLQAANEALERRALQLELSREVNRRASAILDVDELLSEVVELIRTYFGYYFVSAWLLERVEQKEEAVLVMRACSGPAELRGFTIPLKTNSIIASVGRSGERRLVTSVHEAPDYLALDVLPDIASELALPLRMGDMMLGVLSIASDHPNAFSEEDQLLLASLADQIAIAIRNAHLYEAEQRRRQLAELLQQTGRALSSSLDLSQIPGLILSELQSLIPYERGLVLLQEGERLRATAAYGFPAERVERLSVTIREGDVFQQLAEAGRPIIIHDVTQEPGWKQLPWLPLNRSWLGVPLISKGEVVGMISLTRREAHAFAPEDAMWVQAFAAQAVIALENARLYAEITRFNEQLEHMVRERTEELNRAYRNLERLDRTKSDFIEVAAHELRTPLTVIKGYTQLLRYRLPKELQVQVQQILEGIIAGTDRLSEIVSSMLDVSRIDTQTLKMIKEPTSLTEIIHRVHVGFIETLDERRLTMTFSGLDALPTINGDPDLLYKVFYQLIVNAIKYTPDGGHIEVSGRTVEDASRPEVEIVVRDTGIGIDPEDLELIFEKFYQTGDLDFHSSGRTKFKGGGPGLGLAIARGIVLAHGGRIWAESEGCDEERCPGSRFYVRLPVDDMHDTPPTT